MKREIFSIDKFIGTFFKRIYFVLSFLLIVFLLATYSYITSPRIYEVKSLIQVQNGANTAIGYQDILERGGSQLNITEQLELYKSRTNLLKTIKKLQLNVLVDNESLESIQNKPFNFIDLETRFISDLDKNRFFSIFLDEEHFTVVSDGGKIIADKFPYEKKINTDFFTFKLEVNENAEKLRSYNVSILSDSAAVKLLEALEVSKAYDSRSLLERNNLIYVSMLAEDRILSIDIINSMNDLFINQSIQAKAEEATKSLDFIESRISEIESALSEAESNLNEFKKRNANFDLDLEAKVKLDQLSLLDEKITEIEILALQESLKLNSSSSIEESLAQQIRLLQNQKQEIKDEFSLLPETQQEYLNLFREVELNRNVFTDLLQKKLEFSIVEASTLGNIRIIDEAYYNRRVSPSITRTYAGFISFGIFVSLLYLIIQTIYFRKIGLPSDIDSEFNSLNRIGVVVNDSSDGFEDAFDSVVTNLFIRLQENQANSFVVSGATKELGKTFCSILLAKYFAKRNKKVLLIDTDFRRGDIHSQLNIGKIDKEIFKKENFNYENLKVSENFYVCPRIKKSSEDHTNILSSNSFRDFLIKSKEHFDYVIVDTPPILSLSHALIVRQYVDTMLLVIRHQVTSVNEIDQVIKEMNILDTNEIDYIYNDFQKPKGYYGYDYYAYKYYNQYQYYSYDKKD